MDFELSAAAHDACARMWEFMNEEVFDAEPMWARHLAEHGQHSHPPVMQDLKESARRRGLWNLFLPELGGLLNVEYAAVAEITGWSPVIAPEAINCQAPDTGNMETLLGFGSDAQKATVAGATARRADQVGVRHDRAGCGLFGRRQHPDVDRSRR